jgi:hypothetical protein
MPPEASALNHGLSQVFDAVAQAPQYTTTTVQPNLGGFHASLGQTSSSNPSTNLLPMQQKAPIASQPGVQVMPQVGCNYPAMPTSYQHTVQPNQQATGVHQGHMHAGFQNQASAAQPMNPFQQVNGPQIVANVPIAEDRGPQRYAEGY